MVLKTLVHVACAKLQLNVSRGIPTTVSMYRAVELVRGDSSIWLGSCRAPGSRGGLGTLLGGDTVLLP